MVANVALSCMSHIQTAQDILIYWKVPTQAILC